MKDDGIGPRLVSEIEKKLDLRNVKFVAVGTPGLGLLHQLGDAENTLVIDCIDFGGEAGQAVILDEAELLELSETTDVTGHCFGLVDTLKIKKAAGIKTKVKIIGIQPEEIDWGLALSENLKRKMPILVDVVIEQVKVASGQFCPARH
jgi:hydrogenase maturation protease